jgi:protein-L-isoaspartate(D-aspartate) O-methyltransferase
MFDSAAARRMMVDGQIRTADVTDLRLLAAVSTVPREQFVPTALEALAYADGDIMLGNGRALLKPMVLARLIQAADIGEDSHVLDLACGTGYSSAVLSQIAGSVVALEEDAGLARTAQDALARFGAERVTVATGPLTAGWPAAAPYDVILVNGAVEVLPDCFASQLKPDGRLVCIHGKPPNGQATIYRLVEGRLLGRPVFDACAVPLPGFAAPQRFVF